MIEKTIDGKSRKYFGCCDICGEETSLFYDWYDCQDWIKENWRYYFNQKTQEWEILCENCKNLK